MSVLAEAVVVEVVELWLCRRLFIFVGTPAGRLPGRGFFCALFRGDRGVESYEP